MKKTFLYRENIAFFLFFAILLPMVVFSGCTNLMDSDTAESKSPKNKTILITATSEYPLFENSNGSYLQNNDSSRTILPDFSNLSYYILYRNVSNSGSWISKKVNFSASSSTSGTIPIDVPAGSYSFELFALTPESAREIDLIESPVEVHFLATATFYAVTSVDLNTTNNIYFILRLNNNSSGKGKFSINFTHDKDWLMPENCSVTAGIYEINSDKIVYPDLQPQVIKSNFNSARTINGLKFESSSPVKRGTYDLVLTYTYKNTNSENVVNHYTDKILIIIGETTETTISVPNFLTYIPAAPSCLVAGYKDPIDESGFFQAQFKWYDNSNVETGFKFELLTPKKTMNVVLPKDEATWKSYIANGTVYLGTLPTTGEVSQFNCSLINGRDIKELKLNLPLGNRYIARVCATNNAGDSDWCYLTLPQTRFYTDPDDSTKSVTIDDDYSCFESNVTSVNRYRIKYFLNGGELKCYSSGNEIDGPSISASDGSISIYESQHNISATTALLSTTKVKILTPDNFALNDYTDLSGNTITNATMILFDEKNPWTHWTLNRFAGVEKNKDARYESAPAAYVPHIIYYSDASGTELSPQPTASDYNSSGLYVGKHLTEMYTGFENVSYIAHYANENDAEDLSSYEINANNVGIHFSDGNTVYQINDRDTVADTDCDGKITFADIGTNFIEVSKSRVSYIYLTAEANGHTHDSVTLTATKSGEKVKIIDNSSYSIVVTDEWLLYLRETDSEGINLWNPGLYSLYIIAKNSEKPGKSFGYYITMKVTE